jgi:hypothetical protein
MSEISEKLCPNCKIWSSYSLEERQCKNCGSLLDKNEIIYQEKKRNGLIPPFPKTRPFLEIKDSYPLVLRLILQILRPIYFTFMFIISAILWFVVWAAA